MLNNLAWLYSKVNDKRALATAEQAYKLAPKSAAVLDTYGWILVSQHELEHGISMLREASELSGKNPEIQFHLASALVQQGGAQEEAKLLVKSLVQEGKLKSHDGLKALQKQLGL